MKKTIFKKLYIDTAGFFLTFLLIMSLIVWTLQAVNYFDFVTEDGHGLKIYFTYTLLTFPKIINRILPFIFFISLFYILLNYELKNELNIFWVNGISKINFLNRFIIFSVYLMIFQLLLSAYISPLTQLMGRNYLKSSNIDFFTSLIKEGKFINIAKNLTIFIENENVDGSYNNIFLEDERSGSRMIYAKKGVLINDNLQKKLKLVDGRVINNENSNLNIFDFDEIDFQLKNLDAKTIVVPKIQEIDTLSLLNCHLNFKIKENKSFNCEEKLKPEINRELFKRIYKPFFLPIITIICCFIIIKNKNHVNYRKNNILIFTLTTLLIVFSEISMRYIATSNFLTIVCLLTPMIIFTLSYYIFYKSSKYV